MSFDSLGLSAELLRAVNAQGYTQPTPIQERAIPAVLRGRDLMAAAQTGTGKTAAFAFPLLQHLQKNPRPSRAPRVLILAPTRELAAQNGESIQACAKYLPFRTTVIFGGVGIHPQIERLRHGVDIVVATPGRLLDHVQQHTIDLRQIEILVLDEADRMLDMGFIRDIRRILALLPKQRQNLMFSATFSDDIRKLAAGILHNPETIEVAPRNSTPELVSQQAYFCDKGTKRALLSWLIGSGNWQQVLVFTRTKHGANRLCEHLQKDGIMAAAIHGNKSQGARTRALDDFKHRRIRALVATDIAARGLDIAELPYVVNFELPNVPEDYVHRIGRTARAGHDGIAISLVSPDEREFLRDIERLLKQKLPQTMAEGFKPNPALLEQDREDRPARREHHSRPAVQRHGPMRQRRPAAPGGHHHPERRVAHSR
ncbi:MAG: DEAD/DEAH box helicase [Gammaproteobacteria bacterium]